MSPAQQMAQTITRALPRLKHGSLKFFGEWFGRPWDNNHSIVAAQADENLLRLTFDDDETLDVWDPTELELESNLFVIRSASRVRWEWFAYGEPKTPDSRHYVEYRNGGSAIQRRADRPSSVGPAAADPHQAAVTIN
jgi:hypothetical protein